MGGEVTLQDALEQIEQDSSIKKRAEGLANLKHVLRHNQSSSSVQALGDISFHRIYEVLFRIAISEQSTWLNAKAAVTKSAAETRLSNCASALRLAVEVGARTVKTKTVKALLDHVIQTLPLPSGDLCTPLALDYAKCLRTMVAYQPHVEHLMKKDWEPAALFCVANIDSADTQYDEDAAVSGAENRASGVDNSLSYRSSRSHYRESASSQSGRSLFKQVTDELIAALSLLTAPPNAPLRKQAPAILWSLIGFLKRNAVAGRSHQDAFAAINHVLRWTRTEDISLTQAITSQLLRLIRHFWSQKSANLRDEMSISLLLLQPYIAHCARKDDGITLRSEIGSLLDVLRAEYGKRLDREQLQLEDLRLTLSSEPRLSQISTTIFKLRPTGGRAEHNWTLVNMLALLCKILSDDKASTADQSDDDMENAADRPRKRQRLTDNLEEVLALTARGTMSSRVCALQAITFLSQQMEFSVKQISRTIDHIASSCSEENGSIASWALLATASLAAQSASTDNTLSNHWNTLWQVAVRVMSNTSMSRAACHLLHIMHRLRLVVQATFSELLSTMTQSMDLNGPAVLADSALHLLVAMLEESQQTSPGTTHALADSSLSWLLRNFIPSRFDEKGYAITNSWYDAGDVTSLVQACLNQRKKSYFTDQVPVWESVAQAWISEKEQRELVSYLLLLPKEGSIVNVRLNEKTDMTTTSLAPRIASETLTLNHLIAEMSRTLDSWNQWSRERPHSISADMFRSLCQSCCIVGSIACGLEFRDARRQTLLQKQLVDVLGSLRTFASGPTCGQDKTTSMLQLFSQVLPGYQCDEPRSQPTVSDCERMFCRFLFEAGSSSQRVGDMNSKAEEEDEDLMDMDDNQESQDSRRGQATADALDMKSDSAVAFSALALRSNITLYTTAITMLADEHASSETQQNSASPRVADYILSLPETTLLMSRVSLSLLPTLGLLLLPADANHILDRCSAVVLESYVYERSEVALGAILDIMSSLTIVWTGQSNQSLYDLGIDTYRWFTDTALSAGVLSPNVQKRMAGLLLQLCHIDTDYGHQDEVRSVRTSLFKLLELGSIEVKYYLADRISTIFGLYVLSKHTEMFDDLQTSLPIDSDWIEGMAMRLLFFARLASAWHSLLRTCVYYVFETAGRLKASMQYAAYCIEELSLSLRFGNPQSLFRLFAPQLLFTWLENEPLARLPFATFQYQSLDALLQDNQAEITAQLLMKGNDEGMQLLTTALKVSARYLAKRSFAKCMAYSISRDVVRSSSETVDASSETRLRNLLGTKEEMRELVGMHFATIMGHFFLTTEQDDPQDRWLEKKPAFASVAEALKEIKSYSFSPRALPESQQPCFKSRYLTDVFGRLCRRTQLDPLKPWSASSFSLAARMILDAIDDALGPLHTCLLLRRLRVLICMAGEVATTGFPLEMLLQAIRPFLNDSECADDALGMLQYLLRHGQSYLRSSNLAFVNGTITVMVLKMQQHITAKQDSTTQESQHKVTVQKMETFQTWLVRFLQQCLGTANAQPSGICDALVKALAQVRLPGNAHKGSAESTLLLLLLEQQDEEYSLLLSSQCKEALSLLTKDFDASATATGDCLSGDMASVAWANRIWNILRTSALDESFLLWGAEVLGRAYASTGMLLRAGSVSAFDHSRSATKAYEGITESQAKVAQSLTELLFSQDRVEAGLADHTLRLIPQTFNEPEDVLVFEQMLPNALVDAIAEGTFGYSPIQSTASDQSAITQQRLRHALEVSVALSDEDWYRTLASCLCQWASDVPVVPALSAVLRYVPGLAAKLLPSVIHIVLLAEDGKQPVLRTELSTSLALHLTNHDPRLRARQRFLLEILLYLRGQPLPGEKTKADRLKWLDVDYLAAADAAIRCGMPACALLLVESAAPMAQTNRRTSSRASMSQLSTAHVSDELLLAIFKQIDEPDSFYGVQQPATLESVLDRLDYERDGFKSLMFRSAQMDSAMRSAHRPEMLHSNGIARSLLALNLDSISYALLSGSAGGMANNADDLLDTAKKLQQWDLAPPERLSSGAVHTFAIFQELNRARDQVQVQEKLRSAVLKQISGNSLMKVGSPSLAWCNTLASLTEIGDVLKVSSDSQLRTTYATLQARQGWMRMARFEDCYELQSNRQTLFSVLAQNKSMLDSMHVSRKACRFMEVESLLNNARFARDHGVLQEALSLATQASALQSTCKELGLNVGVATSLETASVLWDAGETAASVRMLRDIVSISDIDDQDIRIGRSGLLAQLAHQLADARLEKPDEILAMYLKPAIKNLKGHSEGAEAGKVYHEFASFCEQQLHNSGNLEDFNRIAQLRQKKLEEVEGLEALDRKAKRDGTDRTGVSRLLGKARQWFQIDDTEYQRMKQSRDTYTELSLQNYLLALRASGEHDICVLRFFALWLDNSETASANHVAGKHLPGVPSWKFVVLNNQLMSRLENDNTAFQVSLRALAKRVCADHPYHSLHYLYSSTRKPVNKDPAALSRYQAASNIRGELQSDDRTGDLLKRVFTANGLYNILAQTKVNKENAKIALKDFSPAVRIQDHVQRARVPPATLNLPLRPDGNYDDVPTIQKFASSITIMTGISAPKTLVAYATDGQQYKQLFKGGNDDLRQDAIMEQVFEEVSKMLRNHKATRQRNLQVRTYKVVPLTTRSGIIEFVPNSLPISDFLQPAHLRYYPNSYKPSAAREKISAVQGQAKETRIREYRKVCEHLPPVLRHFFLERFNDPDEWFEKRTNYTRTTATVSILGHVLGLGDRHCHNILLDEKSGEVVHIDLGVAFEAGRVLPVPELVPFRLTRDIVDGMGITKTEGVFRRCCEFTMDALREDKDSILTLLNVLRYDPLYSWTLSPLRAKKMQDAQDLGREAAEEASSKRKEHEAGEADRALSIVEKKLSKTLSTAATVNELIQQATDEGNLATLFSGWAAYY